MNDKNVIDAFDECLEALKHRHQDAAACLERHPDVRNELTPLLETASLIDGALQYLPPSGVKDRVRRRVMATLPKMRAEAKPRFSWGTRLVTATVSLLLVLGLSGGLAVAAGGSMPGQVLYPVKLASEQVALALTPGAEAKAELYAGLAGRRVDEIVYLAGRGDAAGVNQATQRMSAELAQLPVLLAGDNTLTTASTPPSVITGNQPLTTASTPPSPVTIGNQPQYGGSQSEIETALGSRAAAQQAELTAALGSATAGVRDAVAQALEASTQGYQRVLGATP